MKVEIEEPILLQLFEDSAILDALYSLGIKHYSIYGKVDQEKVKRGAGVALKEAKSLMKRSENDR